MTLTLTDFTTDIRTSLTEFFATRRAVVAAVGPVFAHAASEVEQFVLRGGKRGRPAFAWHGWLGAGGDPNGPDAAAVLRACAALELVQANALIHDDIIDASAIRRGFPTIHVTFADQHRANGWAGDPDRYGVGAAILLGDLALAWADDMVRDAGLSPDATARLAPVWSAMRTEVLGGQILDITSEAAGDDTLDAAMRINRYKTAAYTVERPLHLGAALAAAEPDLTAAYRSFGTDIGVAFQLRDDLLGVYGDPNVTGKPAGDDLRTGKRTALIALALAAASSKQATFIHTTLGLDDDAAIEALRALIFDLGAVAAVESHITTLTRRALTTLDASPTLPTPKSHLETLALTATQRSY